MKIMQWYNENSHRRYPLVDDCIQQLTQGSISVLLPNDLFLDFQMVSYFLSAGHVRFDGVNVTGTSAVLRFAYSNLANDNLQTFDVTLDNVGSLAIPYHAVNWSNGTRLQVWLGAAANTWLPTLADLGWYTATNAYMQPVLITYQDKHRLDSLAGDTDSVPISGDIYVQDGYNVKATVDTDAGVVQFYAQPGVGAGRSPARVEPSRPGCDEVLLSINEMYADAAGTFRLKGAKGVVIVPVPASNELQFKVALDTAGLQCNKQRQRNQP